MLRKQLLDFNKVRIADADHSLRVCKTIHVNGNPTTVQEYEVRISDQPEMIRAISLDEELLRMPSKTEHFTVTRSEFFLIHRHSMIRVHVRLTGARTRTRLLLVYVRATLNVRVCLFTYVRPGLRFCL